MRERPRRAAVVDPGLAVAFHLAGSIRLAGRRFGGRRREADQAVDRVVQLADHAAGVGLDHRVGGPGADFVHDFFAAEDVGFRRARSTSVVERTTPPARCDRADQRVVLASASVGSVNWTSKAIAFAPASRRRSITRACR